MFTESVSDVVREADFWARSNQHAIVQKEDVEKALQEIKYRNSFIQEKMFEMIWDGQIYIDTEGKKSGQVNSLYVTYSGLYEFGSVSRFLLFLFFY